MKKNFLIDQAIALSCGDQYFDLHNRYDFQGFSFDIKTKTMLLKFKRSIEISESKNCILIIKFFDVDYFELSKSFTLHTTSHLEELGYKSPSDRDHDWLVNENKSTSTDHMFFRFADDQYIRIRSKWAEIEAGECGECGQTSLN